MCAVDHPNVVKLRLFWLEASPDDEDETFLYLVLEFVVSVLSANRLPQPRPDTRWFTAPDSVPRVSQLCQARRTRPRAPRPALLVPAPPRPLVPPLARQCALSCLSPLFCASHSLTRPSRTHTHPQSATATSSRTTSCATRTRAGSSSSTLARPRSSNRTRPTWRTRARGSTARRSSSSARRSTLVRSFLSPGAAEETLTTGRRRTQRRVDRFVRAPAADSSEGPKYRAD